LKTAFIETGSDPVADAMFARMTTRPFALEAIGVIA
jgi:hypothetical protein